MIYPCLAPILSYMMIFLAVLNHEQSRYCIQIGEKRMQHINAELTVRALDKTFTACGVELERAEVVKNLRREMCYETL